MNRVAVWILGSISGFLLVSSVLTLSTVAGYGYSTMSSCTSTDGSLCAPVAQQSTLTLLAPTSLTSGPGAFALTIIALAVLIGLPAWIGSPILALRRGSSARTTILIVAVIASALLIISVVVIPLTSSVLHAQDVCLGNSSVNSSVTNTLSSPALPSNCYTGDQAFWIALAGITLPPTAVALLLGMPAWIMTLTQTARLKQWGWFVAALLFSPIAALLYAFFGARNRPTFGEQAPAAPVTGPVAPASQV
jgi:hypothetical protein